MGTLAIYNREAAEERIQEWEEIATLRARLESCEHTIHVWMQLFKDAQDEITRLEKDLDLAAVDRG